MKIQKGKVAILLLVLVLALPLGKGVGGIIEERAMDACTATPTSELDFEASVKFSWSPLGWVCQQTQTDQDGKPNGIMTYKNLPLLP